MTQDALLGLVREVAVWNFDGGGCAVGTRPGEVEEHGVEGHGWSKLTYPSIMIEKDFTGQSMEIIPNCPTFCSTTKAFRKLSILGVFFILVYRK